MTNHLVGVLRQTARTLAITLFLGASFLGTAAFAGEQLQETLPAQQQEQKATPAPAAPAGDYAARESQAPATLAKFEGGDTVVVVGGTTLVIVLLVVLILVIL